MIENLASGKSVSDKVEIAQSHFSRMHGLMFAQKPKCILFKFGYEGRHSIHSFFVFFPFDAVYLDARMRVTEVFSSVAPFTPLVTPSEAAAFLLEMPQGYIKKLEMGKGNEIGVG